MRSIIQAAAIVAALFASVAAEARVTITDNSVTHFAVGELRTAAVAGADGAYIYCDISGNTIDCGAYDGVGKFAYCYSDDPKFKRLFPGIGPDSTVKFFWDANSRCVRIDVSNASRPLDTRSPNAQINQVPVGVAPQYHYAFGQLGVPPTGTLDTLNCTVQSNGVVQCAARDANGVFGGCTATADSASQTLDDMTLAVSGLNDSSYVFFQWDDSFRCTGIYVEKGSFNVQ